ncbi:MAG: hypothetical protein OQJ97_00170 [Rhodospirillales bacterium]|nr:hypothetical protein [Rhodospirillales bacterium]
MKTRIVFTLLFLTLGNTPLFAETLVWGTVDFPPGYITKGSEKGQGYGDLMDKFMAEKLPQYDHQTTIYPNWERQFLYMKPGPLLCTSILWYRPPEERASLKGSYLLSAPSGVFFQHDVIVHKNKRHLFGEEVSFKELLHNQGLYFGYNRPYGITYNRILADYLGISPGIELDAMDTLERLQYLHKAKNIHVRSGSNMINGMLKMLLANRVDYTLEYDFMIKYQRKEMEFGDQLVSIPVKEVKDKISWLAYACSDTPQGEKAIAAINKVLKLYRDTEEFKTNLSYLVPKGRENLYWQEYKKILQIFE